jgi:hypothetical protein
MDNEELIDLFGFLSVVEEEKKKMKRSCRRYEMGEDV